MIPLGVLGAAGRAPSSGGILGYFANGERGFWVDPMDLASMHQDAAGTVPVTAPGEPVGRILDRTPNGVVFDQAVAGKSPELQLSGGVPCLNFDAALSQFLVTPGSSDISPRTESIMIVAAVEVDSVANDPVVFSRARAAGVLGRYWLQFGSAGDLAGRWDYPAGVRTAVGPSGLSKRIISMMINRDYASPSHGLHVRSGGSQIGFATLGAESTSLEPSIKGRIGAYGTALDDGETANYFDGRMFGLIVRLTPTPSLSDLEGLEAELAAHVGL